MSQPATVGPVDTTGQRGIGTNWAGNYTYRAARLVRPTSVDELCELVARPPRCGPWGRGTRSPTSPTPTASSSTWRACRPTCGGSTPAPPRSSPSVVARGTASWPTPWRSGAGRCATWRRCRTSRSPAPSPPARTGRATGLRLPRRGGGGARAGRPGRRPCAGSSAGRRRTSTGRWSRSARSASSPGSSSTSSRPTWCARRSAPG